MKEFQLVNATSVEEAAALLREGNGTARLMAGGTDLLGGLKREIHPTAPEVVVNIQTIPGMAYVKEEDGVLKIGAQTRLRDIAEDEVIKTRYTALADAARKSASPTLRRMGTIGGNICQENRCWYYRATDNYFDCLKKGGSLCYAVDGDNRYHSIFDGIRVEGLPCSTDCPSSIDIPDVLAKVEAGDMAGAAALLLENNPLPAVTGRICPHFCEGNCNRKDVDQAVAIREVERAVGDYILEHAAESVKAPVQESGKHIAVVGAGPAGLSAAFYLRRKGHRVTIYDDKQEAGGMLTYGVPAFRLPKAVVKAQIDALKAIGIDFKMGVTVGREVKLDHLTADYVAVFIACGAWKGKSTGIQGEEHLLSGIKFLNDVACGLRKAPGQHVGVLGGGNTAIDVIRTLQRMGAEPVLVYRRTRAEMPAIADEVEMALEEGIEMRFLTQPLAVTRDGSTLTLLCSKMELGAPDASGRRRPVPIPGSEFSMAFDAVITAFGEEADTSFVPDRYLNQDRWLQVDAGAYAGGNLFGGGDYVSGPSTVTEAMASGKKAARAIDRYVGGKANGCGNGCGKLFDLGNIYFEPAGRADLPHIPVQERTKNLLAEDVSGLPGQAMQTEASRCLNCGCIAVNPSDTAPALVALDAQIVTTKRTIPAEAFWTARVPGSTVLDADELVTEIRVPAPAAGTRSAFVKFATRGSIDFPIVNCAVAIGPDDARICLNAVHPNPYRATEAEEVVKGKAIDEALAEAAGEAAVSRSKPLAKNKYKVQIAKTLVKRAVLACK